MYDLLAVTTVVFAQVIVDMYNKYSAFSMLPVVLYIRKITFHYSEYSLLFSILDVDLEQSLPMCCWHVSWPCTYGCLPLHQYFCTVLVR